MEIKKNYTQGEWELCSGDNYFQEINLPNNSEISVSRVSKNTGIMCMSRDEMNANAKLISQAPRMAEENINCIDGLDELKSLIASNQIYRANQLIEEMEQTKIELLTAAGIEFNQ